MDSRRTESEIQQVKRARLWKKGMTLHEAHHDCQQHQDPGVLHDDPHPGGQYFLKIATFATFATYYYRNWCAQT